MTTALVLFTLHGLLFLMIIRSLDYLEPEPPLLIAMALAWGALLANALTVIANPAVIDILINLAPPDFVAAWGRTINAPVIEEAIKALGVITIVLLAGHRLTSVADGLVYGALVGLGFHEIENINFAFIAVNTADAGDTTKPVINTFSPLG